MRGKYVEGMRFTEVTEGRSGIVSVLGNTVYGGGVYDGKFNIDPVNDVNGITRAYALAGMRGAPRRVLMIGLSTGSWAQVLAHHPGIDRLDIIPFGTSRDCNATLIPDECEIAAGTSDDCSGNGVPDECEPDCNENDVPDDCDVISGTSADCQGNGVPDECEGDCNENGVADECDIDTGTTTSAIRTRR